MLYNLIPIIDRWFFLFGRRLFLLDRVFSCPQIKKSLSSILEGYALGITLCMLFKNI